MHADRLDAVTITCYDDEVPPFAAETLEQLYHSLYSSLAMFRVYNPLAQVSTYVARAADGSVRALFLFRREGARLQVCNEVMRVEAREVARFAAWAFARYAGVAAVAFRAVECPHARLPFPYQRTNVLEDIVLPLPASVDAYLAALGKSTRKTVRGYMNRLQRSFPDYRFEVREGPDVRAQDVLDIIRMNHLRMAGKDKVSAYDAAETRRIATLVRQCGVVSTLELGGRVCAGTVSFRVGRHYFMSIAAHDPRYDDFRLGTLSSFLIISECIRRGGEVCHLMWGRHEYKFRLLGQLRELDDIVLYRSPLAMLRHAQAVLAAARQAFVRAAQRRLAESRRRQGLVARLLALIGQGRRVLRHGLTGMDAGAQAGVEAGFDAGVEQKNR